MSENENHSNNNDDHNTSNKSSKKIDDIFSDSKTAKIDISLDVNELVEQWSQFSTYERQDQFSHLHRTEAEELFLNLNASG